MSNEEKDIYDRLETAGYLMAQDIYRAENSGISTIESMIKKYTGRMLNYIRNNKKVEFILYLEKICAGIYIQPRKNIIDILKASDTRKFQELALAFMMGFMSDKKKENEKGGKSE